jgi:hypothetical protein
MRIRHKEIRNRRKREESQLKERIKALKAAKPATANTRTRARKTS